MILLSSDFQSLKYVKIIFSLWAIHKQVVGPFLLMGHSLVTPRICIRWLNLYLGIENEDGDEKVSCFFHFLINTFLYCLHSYYRHVLLLYFEKQ